MLQNGIPCSGVLPRSAPGGHRDRQGRREPEAYPENAWGGGAHNGSVHPAAQERQE